MSGGRREELDLEVCGECVNALCYHLGLFGGNIDLGSLSGSVYAGPEAGKRTPFIPSQTYVHYGDGTIADVRAKHSKHYTPSSEDGTGVRMGTNILPGSHSDSFATG